MREAFGYDVPVQSQASWIGIRNKLFRILQNALRAKIEEMPITHLKDEFRFSVLHT